VTDLVPIVLALAGVVVAAAGAMLGLALLRFPWRGEKACGCCGYALQGLAGPTCPECGDAIDQRTEQYRQKRQWSHRRLNASLACGLVGLVLLASPATLGRIQATQLLWLWSDTYAWRATTRGDAWFTLSSIAPNVPAWFAPMIVRRGLGQWQADRESRRDASATAMGVDARISAMFRRLRGWEQLSPHLRDEFRRKLNQRLLTLADTSAADDPISGRSPRWGGATLTAADLDLAVAPRRARRVLLPTGPVSPRRAIDLPVPRWPPLADQAPVRAKIADQLITSLAHGEPRRGGRNGWFIASGVSNMGWRWLIAHEAGLTDRQRHDATRVAIEHLAALAERGVPFAILRDSHEMKWLITHRLHDSWTEPAETALREFLEDNRQALEPVEPWRSRQARAEQDPG